VTDVGSTEELDLRLRHALGALRDPGGSDPGVVDPAVRRAVVAELDRRRARRRRVGAGMAAAVLVVAVSTGVTLSLPGSSSHRATGAPGTSPHPSATDALPPGRSPAAGPSHPSAVLPPGCAEVEVGSSPAACAGTFATGSAQSFGIDRVSGASNAAAYSPASPASSARQIALRPGPTVVAVGRRLTVRLPARSGAAPWSVPVVAGPPAGGTREPGAASPIGRLRALHGEVDPRTGAATAQWVATRPGSVVLEARSGTEHWSLTVEVDQ
jgi:hypothetical protein